MANIQREKGLSSLQSLSTVLALVLPVLQFFFSFLPGQAKSIFVFQDILIPVSAVAAIFSYLLIIAFKNVTYFEIALNPTKNKEYISYMNEFNEINSLPEGSARNTRARAFEKKPVPQRPFYLTPINIYVFLIPSLMVAMLLFLSLGVYFAGTDDKLIILLQSVSYIISVSLMSLTLAVFYINESNDNARNTLKREKYQKVLQLLYDNNSIPEYPSIEFVAHIEDDWSSTKTYIRVSGRQIYEITTDKNGDSLLQVIPVPDASNGGSQE